MNHPARRIVSSLAVAAALSVSLLSATAGAQSTRADTPPPPSRPGTHAPHDRLFALDGSLSFGAQRTRDHGFDEGPTVYLGASLMYRPSLWQVGVSGQIGETIWRGFQQFYGVLGGVGIEPLSWMRVDILGEAGVHLESPPEGHELFAERTVIGGDRLGAVPYVGLRVAPMFFFGKENSFMIGPWMQLRQDVMHTRLDYMESYCGGLFSNGCDDRPNSSTIGGTLLAAGLRIGGQFGHQ